MIGYLTGKIISKKPTQLLVDVNGVGYLINISINTFENIHDIESTVSLYTYLSVREDALTLYGFLTTSEKEMFEKLISVSGVGPKLAQSILSGIQVSDLKEALQFGDKSRIIAIPGVGKKTADRLIIELKDKVDSILTDGENLSSEAFGIKSDTVNALLALGYNKKTAESAVRKILERSPDLTLEELIKRALSEITG